MIRRLAAVAAFALSGLLYPAAAAFLSVAAGAVRLESLPSPGDRGFAFDLGLLLGGFGVWTLPLTLGMLSRDERWQDAVRAGTNPWVTCLGLTGLALYSAWRVGRAGGLDAFAFEAAFVFLLGVSTRLWLAAGTAADRRHFGETRLELATAECRPGGPVEARLRLQKGARSVEAALELYSADGDEPLKAVKAEVSDASELDGAFVYTLRATLPDGPAPSDGGGWVFSVTARGHRGGVYQDDVPVKLV